MNTIAEQPTRPEMPGRHASLALTLAVHGLLIILLLYGVHWQTTAPEAVEVELVQAMPQPNAVPAAAPAPEAPTQPAPLLLKPDIALKEPAKEPEVAPPTRSTFNPLTLLKREFDQLAQKRNEASQEQELAQLQAAGAAAAVARARSTWRAKIAAKIKGYIVRPAAASGNPEAVYLVTLLPDGSLVGDPRLEKSTGNPVLDDAIERAIRKSSPLPRPDDAEAFQRELVLTFRPLED